MKFMNEVKKFGSKLEYVNYRKTMLDEAQELINEGKIDEGNTKMEDIKELDGDFENYASAQANLNALNNPSMVNIAAVKGGAIIETLGSNQNTDDMFDSAEYRKAFMNHVLKGTSIPANFQNASANTKTTDVAAVIPTTVMNKIIEELTTVGNILSRVTRTFYKGGLSIPTSSLKPTATWVAEGAGSDKQKKTTGSVTFTYHKLRCAISMSLETETVSLDIFESTFVANVVEAMTKAVEQSIFTGTGTGQPKGFLTETVITGQNVDIAAAKAITYKDLCAVEAALPEEYEVGAEWFMTKKTFFGQIAAMVDSNGQPIARVNYGINGKPEYSILGRSVVFTNYMNTYADTVSTATIVACIFNLKDYVLNTNLDMTIKKYEDNDTDDQVTKAVMLVDGKAVDVHSLVTVTKKSA